ncbi:hypothetical protein Syun_001456 [Stephania yunnanensis]|uniref:Uncharacterized protein n=1 Tax=Stephania yunnanensis TaxID=152371 RepID=A0AAP0QAX4_9MAGN
MTSSTAMPHPMTRVCLALPRLCDPDPVAPAFGGLRLLGHLFILFPLILILVARPAVTKVTHVRAEIVSPIPETPAEDTPSTPIDTGVKATVDVRWCVHCLEVTEEPSSSRRSPACRGGAQLVTDEPSPTEYGDAASNDLSLLGVAATLRPRPCGTRIRWS